MKIPAPGSFSPENAPRLSLAPLMAMAILHDIHRLDEPTFSFGQTLMSEKLFQSIFIEIQRDIQSMQTFQ